MVYRDSTDDGFDADMIDEGGFSSEFELEEEAQRLGQRLEFLSTIARLWRHISIAWRCDAEKEPGRHELHESWCNEAMTRYEQLLVLADAVNRYPIVQPKAAHECQTLRAPPASG